VLRVEIARARAWTHFSPGESFEQAVPGNARTHRVLCRTGGDSRVLRHGRRGSVDLGATVAASPWRRTPHLVIVAPE